MSEQALWSPGSEFIEQANITRFTKWLDQEKNLQFNDYESLWEWSTEHIEEFWKTIVEYFDIQFHHPYKKVLSSHKMPGVKWFEGATLNYTEQVFKNYNENYPALISESENRLMSEMSWSELHKQVASVSRFMRDKNIKKGDRVVAFMPNTPETVVAFLATASIGAVWSSCSPEFGAESVIERFKQIKPKLMFAVEGCLYIGKKIDRTDIVLEIRNEIPEIETLILIDYIDTTGEIGNKIKDKISFDEVLKTKADKIEYDYVEFNDPLWVLYSSGTTGKPKAITHSQGGIVLEHTKYLSLHSNVKPGSRFFWYSTTGWMMWNFMMGSLLVGGTAVLYDGSPAYPDMNRLWDLADRAKVETFGTSAAYIMACKKTGIVPKKEHDLSALKSIGSTGSPLPIAGFKWCYENVKSDLWLNSVSGGTDICSVFTGGLPTLSVFPGEIQCRSLGAKVESYDDDGNHNFGRVGEMVISEPMPSMPIYFWNDENFKRYTDSYFEMYPDKWRHGDWIEITERGGAIISGRSDSTLNRGGIRIGTAEIYSAVEKIPEIKDSLIIGLERDEGKYYLPLFVVLQKGENLSDDLIKRISATLRKQFSPRHVPDEVFQIKEVPYTLSGKKMETPVKKYFRGGDIDQVLNKDAMRNPEAFDYFISFKTNHIDKLPV